MITALWARFGKFITGIGAGLLMLASVFYAGRKSGQSKAEIEAANERAKEREAIAVRQVNEAREAAEQQTKAVKNASEVMADNSIHPDSEIVERLRDEWQRD